MFEAGARRPPQRGREKPPTCYDASAVLFAARRSYLHGATSFPNPRLLRSPAPPALLFCRGRLQRLTRLGSSRRPRIEAAHFVSRFASSLVDRNTIAGPQLRAFDYAEQVATRGRTLRKRSRCK